MNFKVTSTPTGVSLPPLKLSGVSLSSLHTDTHRARGSVTAHTAQSSGPGTGHPSPEESPSHPGGGVSTGGFSAAQPPPLCPVPVAVSPQAYSGTPLGTVVGLLCPSPCPRVPLLTRPGLAWCPPTGRRGAPAESSELQRKVRGGREGSGPAPRGGRRGGSGLVPVFSQQDLGALLIGPCT